MEFSGRSLLEIIMDEIAGQRWKTTTKTTAKFTIKMGFSVIYYYDIKKKNILYIYRHILFILQIIGYFLELSTYLLIIAILIKCWITLSYICLFLMLICLIRQIIASTLVARPNRKLLCDNANFNSYRLLTVY